MAALLLALLWASVPSVTALAKGNPRTTAFIEIRRAQAAAARRPFPLQWQWRRLDQISQYLRAAVIYAEDARFYEHHGVDWSAIEHAAQSNYTSGALSIGGSTITQQLAKNLFLSPSRSLVRKAREILIAGRLEDAMNKERLLELYLNVVEWGDGIFGAEAAARHWFARSARQLTPVQAARLASALPNPFTRSPKTRTRALQRKVGRILWQMRRDGLINRAQLAEAAREAGLPPPPSELPAELPPELRDQGDEADVADVADAADREDVAPVTAPGETTSETTDGATDDARGAAPRDGDRPAPTAPVAHDADDAAGSQQEAAPTPAPASAPGASPPSTDPLPVEEHQ